jgi:hypothetical protein
VTALFDLLARGYDLAIVDVSPLLGATVGGALAAAEQARPWELLGDGGWWGRERARRTAEAAALAERLWALKREALRHRYQELGAAVVEWRAGTELEQVIYEVELCRRRVAPTRG